MGIQIQALMLAMQMLYQLSHIPNPSAHCDGVLVQKIGLKLQQGILGDISIGKSGGVIVVTETSFVFSVSFSLPSPSSLLYISTYHQATLYRVYLKAVSYSPATVNLPGKSDY